MVLFPKFYWPTFAEKSCQKRIFCYSRYKKNTKFLLSIISLSNLCFENELMNLSFSKIRIEEIHIFSINPLACSEYLIINVND